MKFWSIFKKRRGKLGVTPEYMFCETWYAAPLGRQHIRRTDAGVYGSATIYTLCRKVAAWDTKPVTTDADRANVCSLCMHEAKPTL